MSLQRLPSSEMEMPSSAFLLLFKYRIRSRCSVGTPVDRELQQEKALAAEVFGELLKIIAPAESSISLEITGAMARLQEKAVLALLTETPRAQAARLQFEAGRMDT